MISFPKRAMQVPVPSDANLEKCESDLDYLHSKYTHAEIALEAATKVAVSETLPVLAHRAACIEENKQLYDEMQRAKMDADAKGLPRGTTLPEVFCRQKADAVWEKQILKDEVLQLREENHRLALQKDVMTAEQAVKDQLKLCKAVRRGQKLQFDQSLADSQLHLLDDESYRENWQCRHYRRCSSKCCVWSDEFPPDCRFVPAEYR